MKAIDNGFKGCAQIEIHKDSKFNPNGWVKMKIGNYLLLKYPFAIKNE